MNTWDALLNSFRRKKGQKELLGASGTTEKRTFAERDYDRILFSTPVRRLADKTQVFPLEKHDSVRTRLTHSHEVSNLAKSIGTSLVFESGIAKEVENSKRNIPAILAAVGLAHDLGNPPFGHQGEFAIRTWFKQNEHFFQGKRKLDKEFGSDFFEFEGNAQTLRIVTRLQLLDSDFGLDLSSATLAALMKYTVGSSSIDKKTAATKKNGFFQSEKKIAEDVLDSVGLRVGQRHPLAYIMEASDDIAYSVLDVEDAVKKSIISFHDVINHLENDYEDPLVKHVVDKARDKFKEYRQTNTGLSPFELGDISMQRLRVEAILVMVNAVHESFAQYEKKLLENVVSSPLIELGKAKQIVNSLKNLASERAYRHRSVLEIELSGYNILHELMDMIWFGIIDRKEFEERGQKRTSTYGRYVFGRISENYRRVFEKTDDGLPTAYKEAQLLTDMIAGMTDSFALQLHRELKSFEGKDFKQHMAQAK